MSKWCKCNDRLSSINGKKATLRNGKPVVLAVSTNDALGLNGVNLHAPNGHKNIYFVPFGQDAPEKNRTQW
ncbi:hypothetical protein AAHB54_31365 [Bacillus cereus]